MFPALKFNIHHWTSLAREAREEEKFSSRVEITDITDITDSGDAVLLPDLGIGEGIIEGDLFLGVDHLAPIADLPVSVCGALVADGQVVAALELVRD